jgi:hypothetical protein
VNNKMNRERAKEWATKQTDAMLASIILEALLDANADLYGPDGNPDAIAALDELALRLKLALRLTDRTDNR